MSNLMGAYPDVDKTLTQDGMAADAKAEFTVTASNITVKITADTKPDCDLNVTWYLEV